MKLKIIIAILALAMLGFAGNATAQMIKPGPGEPDIKCPVDLTLDDCHDLYFPIVKQEMTYNIPARKVIKEAEKNLGINLDDIYGGFVSIAALGLDAEIKYFYDSVNLYFPPPGFVAKTEDLIAKVKFSNIVVLDEKQNNWVTWALTGLPPEKPVIPCDIYENQCYELVGKTRVDCTSANACFYGFNFECVTVQVPPDCTPGGNILMCPTCSIGTP